MYLAQSVLNGGATVHECLCDDRQTGVNDVGLVDVKHKLWVLDDVHPESQWKTADPKTLIMNISLDTNRQYVIGHPTHANHKNIT